MTYGLRELSPKSFIEPQESTWNFHHFRRQTRYNSSPSNGRVALMCTRCASYQIVTFRISWRLKQNWMSSDDEQLDVRDWCPTLNDDVTPSAQRWTSPPFQRPIMGICSSKRPTSYLVQCFQRSLISSTRPNSSTLHQQMLYTKELSERMRRLSWWRFCRR